MIRNYIRIAIRNLTRHAMFSAINLLCLSIGIVCCLLIGVFVINEKNINTDIRNVKNQYVVKSKWKKENQGIDITTLGPLVKTMKDQYPGLVENYYRFDPVTNIVSVGDERFRENIAVGDTSFINMFGFKLLEGDQKVPFRNESSAVVTEDFALKYFGKIEVIDKTITVQTPAGGKHDYMISGVMKSMGYNSVMNFTDDMYNVFLPMSSNKYFQLDDVGENWANIYMVSMITLKDGVDPSRLKQPFEQVVKSNAPDFVKENLQVELAPMKDYYLKSKNGAAEKMIATLSLIAIFILSMAIMNFINIKIGTSIYRLKEIGLRKVFGGRKWQLIFQHITESVVLTLAATLLSLLLYEALRPLFNQLLDTHLTPVYKFGYPIVLLLIGLIVGVGILSGIYPAFVLSSSNVLHSIKGKLNSDNSGMYFRKGLLTLQFTLAILIFICALTVSKQINYVLHTDLGYKKDQVMVVSSLPRQWDSVGVLKMEQARTRLLQIPAVNEASLSYDVCDGKLGAGVNVFNGESNGTEPHDMLGMVSDENFAAAYSVPLIEGSFFNKDKGSFVPNQVVLNESAVKALGWTNATGKTLKLGTADGLAVTVAGVLKDFHFASFREGIQPLIIFNVKENTAYRYFSLKLAANNIGNTIATLEKEWKRLFPDAPFEYFFMDEKFMAMYRSEMKLKKAAEVATMLNLVIVFLGVFGLVAFSLNKRNKEIALRKVLGAEGRTIIQLFVREYAWLILLANIVAWPVAYMINNKWLESYAFRIDQNISTYLIAGLVIFLTQVILIAVQCFRASIENPAKGLRAE